MGLPIQKPLDLYFFRQNMDLVIIWPVSYIFDVHSERDRKKLTRTNPIWGQFLESFDLLCLSIIEKPVFQTQSRGGAKSLARLGWDGISAGRLGSWTCLKWTYHGQVYKIYTLSKAICYECSNLRALPLLDYFELALICFYLFENHITWSIICFVCPCFRPGFYSHPNTVFRALQHWM